MIITIEELKDGKAVLETESAGRPVVPAALFEGAEEGAVYRIERDLDEENRRKEHIAELRGRLFK